MIEAIFVDRDGTIGASAVVEFPNTFEAFPWVKETVSLLHANGIKVYGFTNQACIARKKDNGYDFEREFREYGFDGLYLCPHDAADGCECRKPKSGLLYRAQRELHLDLGKCAVVGDRDTDLAAGANAGCKTVLVRTGRQKSAEDEREFNKYNLLFVAEDFREAAMRMIETNAKERASLGTAQKR